MNQVAVAGRAGGLLLHIPAQASRQSGGTLGRDGRRGFVQIDEIAVRDFAAAHAPVLRVADVIHVPHVDAHQAAAEGVDLHGIVAQDHAVGGHGIAALLEVQIAADVVHDGQRRPQSRVQRRDGPVQAHGVEVPLLRVRQAALHVLQRAGHHRLAVSLQHGQVDQIPGVQRAFADADRSHPGLDRAGGIALQIVQRHVVAAADFIVATDREAAFGAVAHPCALHDGDVPVAVVLQILDHALQDPRVGGRAILRLRRNHQVGLQGHRCALGNLIRDVRGLHQIHRHLLRTVTVDDVQPPIHICAPFHSADVQSLKLIMHSRSVLFRCFSMALRAFCGSPERRPCMMARCSTMVLWLRPST